MLEFDQPERRNEDVPKDYHQFFSRTFVKAMERSKAEAYKYCKHSQRESSDRFHENIFKLDYSDLPEKTYSPDSQQSQGHSQQLHKSNFVVRVQLEYENIVDLILS